MLASSAPRGAPGMHGWSADVIGAVGNPKTLPQDFLRIFFSPSAGSQQAGKDFFGAHHGAQRRPRHTRLVGDAAGAI